MSDKNNIKEELINNKDIDHSVPEHDEEVEKKDHYHSIHHFSKDGMHDDVEEKDFDFMLTMKHSSRRNSIFRMTLTAMFLAIAIACTALDELTEAIFAIPTPAGMISLRFLDITIVTLAMGSIGPAYASAIAFIVPVIHWAIHPEHAIFNSILECFAYAAIVWYFWLLYYFIFKNSMFHRTVDKKLDIKKRWFPIIFFVTLGALIFAFFAVLGLYITSLTNTHNSTNGSDDSDADWTKINTTKDGFILFLTFYGFECLRLTITYSIFALLEPSMKIINHRYR